MQQVFLITIIFVIALADVSNSGQQARKHAQKVGQPGSKKRELFKGTANSAKKGYKIGSAAKIGANNAKKEEAKRQFPGGMCFQIL